jgi:hypothetical protein
MEEQQLQKEVSLTRVDLRRSKGQLPTHIRLQIHSQFNEPDADSDGINP